MHQANPRGLRGSSDSADPMVKQSTLRILGRVLTLHCIGAQVPSDANRNVSAAPTSTSGSARRSQLQLAKRRSAHVANSARSLAGPPKAVAEYRWWLDTAELVPTQLTDAERRAALSATGARTYESRKRPAEAKES